MSKIPFTGPLPPRLLAALLVPLARLQRGRLGPAAGAVERAARLRLAPAEAAAEREIDRLRAALAASSEALGIQDYGAGTRAGLLAGEAKPAARRVADVYRRAAATPAWGRFLFRLVRERKPRRVLELGTNLGVSAAHLAAALALNEREGGPPSHLVTLEGDPGLAERAADALAALGHAERVSVAVGRFADTLPDVLPAHGPFDLVFLDGHHEEEATLRYYDLIRPHLAPGAWVALDDVEPGRPVRRAWRRLLHGPPSPGRPTSSASASSSSPAHRLWRGPSTRPPPSRNKPPPLPFHPPRATFLHDQPHGRAARRGLPQQG